MADDTIEQPSMAKRSIRISHFINPTQFWYVDCAPGSALENILEVEKSLKVSIDEFKYPPTVAPGTKVAVFYLAWKKYIRAKVLRSKVKEYIMWAIDYGFPFVTSSTHICDLPSKWAEDFDYVRAGGVNGIVPDVTFLDLTANSKDAMKLEASWDTQVCDQLEELIGDSAAIMFDEELRDQNGKFYGDLELIDCAGRTLKVRDYLIHKEVALPQQDFEGKLALLREIPPWLSNSFQEKVLMNKLPPMNLVISTTRSRYEVPMGALPYQHACQKVNEWFTRNETQSTPDSLGPPETSTHKQGSDTSEAVFDTSPTHETNLKPPDIEEPRSVVRDVVEGTLVPNQPPPCTDHCETPSTSPTPSDDYEPSTTWKYPKTKRVPPLPRSHRKHLPKKIRRVCTQITPRKFGSGEHDESTSESETTVLGTSTEEDLPGFSTFPSPLDDVEFDTAQESFES